MQANCETNRQAPLPATHEAVARAALTLETQMGELVQASALAFMVAESWLSSAADQRQITGDPDTIYLPSAFREVMLFAFHEVDRRADELRNVFYAALNGTPADGGDNA